MSTSSHPHIHSGAGRHLEISTVNRDLTDDIRALKLDLQSSTDNAFLPLSALVPPSTSLTGAAYEYARQHLDPIMFNHSNRVYYIGAAVAQQRFPTWKWDKESYYLACLFHDLGASDTHIRGTRLSFEYEGGILAREFILHHSPHEKEIADEVAEAIFRHTNFVKGKISATGQLLQLSTTLDVIGLHPALHSASTYDEIVANWPRMGFNCHFCGLMEEEMAVKPWSHTTTVEEENGFCSKIKNNPFTKKYDQNP